MTKKTIISLLLIIISNAYNQLIPASVSTAIEVEIEGGKRATRDINDFFKAYGAIIDPAWTRVEIIHHMCNSSSSLFKAHFSSPEKGGLFSAPTEKWLQNQAIYLATLEERKSSAMAAMKSRAEAWQPLSITEYIEGRQATGSPTILIVGCGHIVPYSSESSENHQHEGCFCVNITDRDPYTLKPYPYYKTLCADQELNIRTPSLDAAFLSQFDIIVLERPYETTLQDPQTFKNVGQILKIGGQLYIDFHHSYSTTMSYKAIISASPDQHTHNPTLLAPGAQVLPHYHLALYLSHLGFTGVQTHRDMRSPFAPGLDGTHGARVGIFITATWSNATASKKC